MKPQAIKRTKTLAVLTVSLLSLSVAGQDAAKDKKSKLMQEPTPKQESTPKKKSDTEPPVSADLEATRVKTEIRKIQTMPISQDGKLKKLQALREQEMAKDHPNKATLDTLKLNIAISQSGPSNATVK